MLVEDIYPVKVEKGRSTPAVMDRWFANYRFFIGDILSGAEISLFPFSHMEANCGTELSAYQNFSRRLKYVKFYLVFRTNGWKP
jgi:hypothetical protein